MIKSFLKQLKRTGLAVPAAALMLGSSDAQLLTWNDATGNTQWDTNSVNWLSGATATNWSNMSPPAGADFSAMGVGTVTLGGNITASSITFDSPGYTLTNLSTYTLTLGGTSPSITNNYDGTIGCLLAGTNGLIVDGSGTLTLQDPGITYTGNTTVNSGELLLNWGAGTTGANKIADFAGTISIASNATFVLSYPVPYSSGIDLGFGNVTFVGTGTFVKTGTGWANFGNSAAGNASVNLGAGGLIDVEGGILGNAYTRGIWTSNQASLKVGSNGTFALNENDLFVDAVTGSGVIEDGNKGSYGNTLTIGVAGGSGTFSGVIQNGFGTSVVTLTKTGPGTETLSGNNTYTGPTTINGGTLLISGSLAGNSAVTVQSGGTLGLGSNGIVTGTVTAQSGGTLNGTGTLTGAVTIQSGGTLMTGPAGSTLTINTNLNLAGNVILRINGPISAYDQLIGMIGVTYGGTLTVTNLGASLAAGDTFTLFSSSGYSGSFNQFSLPTLPAGLSWDASQLTLDGSIAVVSGIPPVSFSPMPGGYVGPQTVSINCLTPGATIYYTTNGTTPTINSSSGPSGLTVIVPANAKITINAFAGAPGYTDSPVATAIYTTVAVGVWTNLSGGSWANATNWLDAVIGQGSGETVDFSQLTLSSNTYVTLDGSWTIGNLIFGDIGNANTWEIDAGNGGTLILGSTNTPTITVINQTTTITSPVMGANGLIKAGSGTLIFQGTGITYTGNTTINDGQLVLSRSDGTAGADIIIPTSGTVTIASNAVLAVNYNQPAPLLVSGLNLEFGNVTLVGSGTILKTGTGWAGFGNSAPGNANVSLSPGGLIDVEGGILGNSYGRGIWTSNQASLNVGSNGTFGLIDNNVFVDAVTGSGIIEDGNNGSFANTLTIGVAGGSGTFSGVIQNGVGASVVTLTKTGAGTETLSGANTYTGATTINGGTLLVSGSLVGSSAVTVQSGGTLSGNGTLNIVGAVTIQPGGTLMTSPAGSTLTINNNLNLAGSVILRINGPTLAYDQLMGLNAVTYGGTLTVTNLGASLALGNTFTLFSSGSYSGSFNQFNLPALPAGLSWDASQLTLNGSIAVVNHSAAPFFSPEAGTYIGAQTVSINCLTPGATIYYTTNGTTPTINSPSGLSGVTVIVPANANITINAFAVAPGFPQSAMASAAYVTTPPIVFNGNGSLKGTSYSMSFSGPSGYSYGVLMTTNLALPVADWTLLTTGTFGSGSVQFTNTSATSAAQFYQIVSP